jgi:hypothetical protein
MVTFWLFEQLGILIGRFIRLSMSAADEKERRMELTSGLTFRVSGQVDLYALICIPSIEV